MSNQKPLVWEVSSALCKSNDLLIISSKCYYDRVINVSLPMVALVSLTFKEFYIYRLYIYI